MDKIKNIFATHKSKVIAASSAALAVLIAAGILIAAKASTTAKTTTKPTATAKTEKYAESVELDKICITLAEGQHDKLTATVKPTDAIDKTVQWSSSDKTVCTVSDGAVTAQGVGTAAVTATTLNGKSTVCTVTVSVPAEVKQTAKTTAQVSGAGKSKSDGSDASTGTSKANSGKKNDEDNSNSDDGQNKNSRDNTTINKTNKTIETKNNDQSQSSLTPPPNKEFYKTVSGCNIDYNPFYRNAQVFVDVTDINQKYYNDSFTAKVYRNGVYDAEDFYTDDFIGKNRTNIDVIVGPNEKRVGNYFVPLPTTIKIVCYHNNTEFKTITFSVDANGFV